MSIFCSNDQILARADSTISQVIGSKNLSLTEDFFIQNEQLFHLARIRSKRLSQILPRFIQLCIQASARLAIISAFHDHSGFLKSYLTMKTRYFWVGSATDVRPYVSSCTTCQQIEQQVNKPRLPLTSLPVQDLFECIHVDHHTMMLFLVVTPLSTHPHNS
jgi:Integrase zinc binding domain